MKAYDKDIWRSIKYGKKRFFSILFITTLGVTMFCGLKAACVDLRYSADAFFDDQNLYDIRIVSTLGLTNDDVAVISQIEEVAQVESGYEETLYTYVQDKKQSSEVKAMQANGMNEPYVIEGRLPANANEIAVTKTYITDANAQLGDVITFEEGSSSSSFQNLSYTIVGIVTDVMDVNNTEGAVAFRTNSTSDYTFYVSHDAQNASIVTSIYIQVSDSKELLSYANDYTKHVKQVMQSIEDTIQKDRETARYEEVINEANAKLDQVLQELSSTTMLPVSTLKQLPDIQSQYEEIQSIQQAQWYIQDRTSLSGYANIESDASSIEAVGAIFPIVFIIVAVLISLTTMTRMVEEDRGLIGTYKALGFTNREIRKKYVVYAFAACILGGLFGMIGGFIVLPKIIFTIFETMYQLPTYMYRFDILYGFGGMLLFLLGVCGSAMLACFAELSHMPAILIRPKAPRNGSFVFLEKVPPIWKRLSFLNKVTARNLFRYKKRLLMTVSGIMGCTALVLFGFSLKDSITELMPAQYEDIYQYDIMAVADQQATLHDVLYEDTNIDSYIDLRIDTVTIRNQDGKEEKVQFMVIPDGVNLEGYLQLEDMDGNPVVLQNDGMYITYNVSTILDFQEQDSLTLQNSKLQQADIKVSSIVQNYLGNNIYMTQHMYESLFGEYQPNGILGNLSASCEDATTYANTLAQQDGMLSVTSTQTLQDEFSQAFALINMVVYVIIIMAASLAFVVLFTLSTTNISERTRELATIKVLGFYDSEVHLYVNKETFLLTGIGMLLGLPVGYVLSHCLTYALRMPSIHFAVSIHAISYVIAALITFSFALIVDMVTNRILDKIDPVEALKSVE